MRTQLAAGLALAAVWTAWGAFHIAASSVLPIVMHAFKQGGALLPAPTQLLVAFAGAGGHHIAGLLATAGLVAVEMKVSRPEARYLLHASCQFVVLFLVLAAAVAVAAPGVVLMMPLPGR